MTFLEVVGTEFSPARHTFVFVKVTFNGEIDAEHYGILYGIGSGIDDTQDGEKMLTGVVT